MSRSEYFLKPDGGYSIRAAKAESDLDFLPAGLYLLVPNEFGLYRYVPVDDFPALPEILGEGAKMLLDECSDLNPDTNNSVFTYGKKGTGKSLLALTRCRRAIEQGIPVVQLNEGVSPDMVEMIMNDFKSNVVIYMDEYDDKRDGFYGGKEKVADGEGVFFRLISEHRYRHVQWLLTANSEPDRSVMGRPGRIRHVVCMDEISKDTMVTILEGYQSRIPADIYDYLMYQIKYNQVNANSDLVEQCCRIALNCKTMKEYQSRAKLINAFDGYTRFVINRGHLYKLFKFTVHALIELKKNMEAATTFRELLDLNVLTVESSLSDEPVADIETMKEEISRTVNRLIDSKGGFNQVAPSPATPAEPSTNVKPWNLTSS